MEFFFNFRYFLRILEISQKNYTILSLEIFRGKNIYVYITIWEIQKNFSSDWDKSWNSIYTRPNPVRYSSIRNQISPRLPKIRENQFETA